MNKAKELINDLTTIYNTIGDIKGANISYCDSINGSVFDSVATLALPDEEFNSAINDYEECSNSIVDDCRFLAENERFFPKEMKDTQDIEPFRSYVLSHEDEILDDIRSEAEKDYEYCTGKPFNHATDWNIIYEENTSSGINVGILSDGKHFLFFEAVKYTPDAELKTCAIYNSIKMDGEREPLCQYPWTAGNSTIVIETLNRTPDNEYANGSCLSKIEFPRIVQLNGFFEHNQHQKTDDTFQKMMELSPDEIVFLMDKDYDEEHPFFYAGEDAGDTKAEWLSEEDYGIGEGAEIMLTIKKEYTSDKKHLVCYEPYDKRIEIYNCLAS